jgi:phage portal protein BeeE
MLDLIMPRAGQVTIDGDYGWTGTGIGSSWQTRAGVAVSEEIALTYEAVFAAMRVLAEGVGGIPPLPLYERKSDQNRVTVDGIFDYMVNQRMPAGVFREGRVAHQVGWGNGFAEIEFDAMGNVIALWPIHPSRVTSPRDPESEYDY